MALVKKLGCEYKISSSVVRNAIVYLTNNICEYTPEKVLKLLKNNFSYETCKDEKGRIRYYLFDGDLIWKEFFMKDNTLEKILEHRRIYSMQELLYYSENWHLESMNTQNVEPTYDPISKLIDEMNE